MDLNGFVTKFWGKNVTNICLFTITTEKNMNSFFLYEIEKLFISLEKRRKDWMIIFRGILIFYFLSKKGSFGI